MCIFLEGYGSFGREVKYLLAIVYGRFTLAHMNNFFRCLIVRLCVHDVIFASFNRYVLQVTHAFLGMLPFC